ncbi:hypothetical protein A2V49_02540 [candidate division WWE3 bacterium RBG_19FT_COMBO_34_6]|uniref:Sortase n=1 Tax=candidate division WWE3 bacterium RBG_19FT_COMBO_34_6 TaxID=1802612 RepID=A0A1F4ULS9_UNCKA|nr:MAG: hypothetical protein A2V49_02540 [candidate division WWE3 bacterium RBG_19FT_COMBO_34_6]
MKKLLIYNLCMPEKVYLKDESFDPIYRQISRDFYTKTRILPTFLITFGILIFITQVAAPLIIFKTQDTPNKIVDNATVVGVAAGFKNFEFNELQNTTLSDKSNVVDNKVINIPKFFYLSIPKLNIDSAKVETNAKTLDPSTALGHYAGTSLPGEVGNSFIFGHSVLPWFFNPKNYKTIFSTLDELEIGDEILVNFNNNKYKYIVESKEELNPKEVNPLAELKPNYLNESTIVLMTCSPPGTKLKRLLINAVKVN